MLFKNTAIKRIIARNFAKNNPMTYKETTDWLFQQLPFYQRDGKKAYKANLDNTIALDNALGNPHQHFKSIHVAGTNGKGSTSHLLASILMESGYKVGLYTSPHLKDFTERIVVDGKPVDEDFVVSFVADNKTLLESVCPSFFEMTVAMAFTYFREKKVDFAVIETGLGGRLDSTNIIVPELAVITNISMDHTDILGHTLSQIASEKAGIMKMNVPTVIGRAEDEIKDVFIKKALEMQSEMYFAQEYAVYTDIEISNTFQTLKYLTNGRFVELSCPLRGIYQKENIATVYTSASILARHNPKITEDSILAGIVKISHNMPLRGRWETLNTHPLTICDTAHNYDSITQVCKQLAALDKKHLTIVWGMAGDKDASAIIPLLPKHAFYYLCAPSINRAMPLDILAEHFDKNGLKYALSGTPKEALYIAQSTCKQDGMVFVGGSNFVIAEII